MHEELDKILSVLADRFGTTITNLWGVMVRQEMVVGAINLVWSALALVAFVAAMTAIVKGVRAVSEETGKRDKKYANYQESMPKEGWKNSTKETIGGTAIVIGSVVAVIAALCFPFLMIYGLTHTLNPEYYALTNILTTLRK